MAYCAVDSFALISGFVGYTDTPKRYQFGKYITMWIQVVVYGLSIAVLGYMIAPNVVGIKDILKALMPVTFNQYWYFTAYTGIFFIIPWVNRFMRSMSCAALTGLVFVCVGIFSVFASFASLFNDIFNLNGGYSFLWLMLLYIIGGWMKKCKIPEKSSLKFGVVMFFLWIVTWFSKSILSGFVLESLRWSLGENILISYISPTILMISVGMVILFSKWKVSERIRAIIRYFASSAFGVYLLHTNPIIFKYILKDRFATFISYPVILLPVWLFGTASMIFGLCLIIDKIRNHFFVKFKVEKIGYSMEKIFRDLVEKRMNSMYINS